MWGWSALEADFIRFYQMDVYYEVFVKEISMRRFIVLITGLPADSAWQRFIADKDNYSLPLLT